MTEKIPAKPLYLDRCTKEHEILANAEKFFLERDEKMRYGLVKRVFQWMLDTDENNFFEKAHDAESRKTQIRELLLDDSFWRSEPPRLKTIKIRPSAPEIEGYIRMLAVDTRDGILTGEVESMYDYAVAIKDDIPPQYENRRMHIIDSVQRLNGELFLQGKDKNDKPKFISWIRQLFDDPSG